MGLLLLGRQRHHQRPAGLAGARRRRLVVQGAWCMTKRAVLQLCAPHASTPRLLPDHHPPASTTTTLPPQIAKMVKEGEVQEGSLVAINSFAANPINGLIRCAGARGCNTASGAACPPPRPLPRPLRLLPSRPPNRPLPRPRQAHRHRAGRGAVARRARQPRGVRGARHRRSGRGGRHCRQWQGAAAGDQRAAARLCVRRGAAARQEAGGQAGWWWRRWAGVVVLVVGRGLVRWWRRWAGGW